MASRTESPELLDKVLAAEAKPSDGTAQRILAAAYAQTEDFGLRRFTVDEVARRAGVSRVTVYRHFPTKDALLDAVLMVELNRFLARIDRVLAAQETPEEKLVEGLAFALRHVRKHPVLRRVLRTEPDSLLPYLTVKAEPLLGAACAFIADHLRRDARAGGRALPERVVESAAELIARIVLSFVLTPESAMPLDKPGEFRKLARLYLRPIVSELGVRDD